MNFQVATALAELCYSHGIQHAIICPGSRSAPLVLAFTRNKNIRCLTISDERSAGFVALGMAQQSGQPVALICTSGSAAYNFSPAVAEAFFQHIPLLVISADRPKEWIGQLDGQTIYQENLFGKHVKRFVELPQEYAHSDNVWHANRLINEAMISLRDETAGPVHLNIPFREPLYETTLGKQFNFSRTITREPGSDAMDEEVLSRLKSELGRFCNVLVVAGQQHDLGMAALIHSASENFQWPVVGDILSNLHSTPSFLGHTDTFLAVLNEQQKQSLKPDLLISFGDSLISKNLKLFLRQFKPAEHWHIQRHGLAPDTFQGLTRVISSSPAQFFKQIVSSTFRGNDPSYKKRWMDLEIKARETVDTFFKQGADGEFKLVYQLLQSLPPDSCLHLANSMSARYANHVGLDSRHTGTHVYSNRGTSGIDGCTSTASGHALVSELPHVLITGDQAFFYDRNAFWHNYHLPNLHVVILNNHGGVIFNLIDGPSGLPEASEYFITNQALDARSLAAEFGLDYFQGSKFELEKFLTRGSGARLMEIETSQKDSKSIFENFRKSIKEAYESQV